MGQSWGTLRALAQDRLRWREFVAALVVYDKMMMMMMMMMMNLYSSQREICLGQRFITKIFDRHFIHSHMYILTKVIKVKHFYMIL